MQLLLSSLIAISFLFSSSKAADGFSCSSGAFKCATASLCVKPEQLCDIRSDCPDGSDESKAFCDLWYPGSCHAGSAFCTTRERSGQHPSYVECCSWAENCGENEPAWNINSTMCEALQSSQIPKFAGPSEPVISDNAPKSAVPATKDDMASFLVTVGNIVYSTYSSRCPSFYNNVSNHCLAFLPFQLTWPEALEVCDAISGRLVELSNYEFFFTLVSHIQEKGLVSDFWIGGFYDLTVDGWRWQSGNTMTMGTPFWMLRHQTECSPRVITEKLGPSADCYHYHQAPSESVAGQCASLDYKSMYFINNEPCTEKKRPICLYKK